MIVPKLTSSLRTLLGSIGSEATALRRGIRRSDAVQVFGASTRISRALSGALAEAMAAAFLRGGSEARSIPAAEFDSAFGPFVQANFPGTGDLPTVSEARKRADSEEDGDAAGFVRSVYQNANGRVRKARKAATGETDNTRAEQITVRLTAPDRAALQRDGSIVVTVSAKRRVRIVLA